jgi:hypothetical protein
VFALVTAEHLERSGFVVTKKRSAGRRRSAAVAQIDHDPRRPFRWRDALRFSRGVAISDRPRSA